MTAYAKTTWVDENTDITAVVLNNADAGVYNAHTEIEAAKYIGMVTIWPTLVVPTGWILCDGLGVSRTTYASLFGVIGTTYGAGDGSTTFNVPDLRGLFLRGLDEGRGYDTNDGGAARTLSATPQVDSVKLHSHTWSDLTPQDGDDFLLGGETTSADCTTASRTTTNSGSSFLESRPYNFALNYIIKAL